MSTSKSSSRKKDKEDTQNPDLSLPGIGNYLFQKTVGEGNFAKVKLATHKLTNAEVFTAYSRSLLKLSIKLNWTRKRLASFIEKCEL